MHEGRNVWVDRCIYPLAIVQTGVIFFSLLWGPRAVAQLSPTNITVGSAPVGNAVYPIRNKVYGANQRVNSISVIRGAYSSAIASTAIGKTPRGEPALWSRAKCMYHEHFVIV
jgi:DNA-binding beta-propeller fold protein YncE